MLKGWKLLAAISGTLLAGFAVVLFVTNPDPVAYENFAGQKVVGYVEEKVCIKAPFGLVSECKTLLKSNQASIQQLIATKTYRWNFLFFSIYVTDLSVSSYLPAYKVKTLGVLQRFYIYDAKEAP